MSDYVPNIFFITAVPTVVFPIANDFVRGNLCRHDQLALHTMPICKSEIIATGVVDNQLAILDHRRKGEPGGYVDVIDFLANTKHSTWVSKLSGCGRRLRSWRDYGWPCRERPATVPSLVFNIGKPDQLCRFPSPRSR